MKLSVGLLMVREAASFEPEFLLAHPGGPFFAKKDEGVWSIPKGLLEPGEVPFDAARREFHEETGFHPPSEPTLYVDLGTARQSRKEVRAWAFVLAPEADWTPARLQSNTFELEWPRGSGRTRTYPEVDRAAFFDRATALEKCVAGQRTLIERADEAFQSGRLVAFG